MSVSRIQKDEEIYRRIREALDLQETQESRDILLTSLASFNIDLMFLRRKYTSITTSVVVNGATPVVVDPTGTIDADNKNKYLVCITHGDIIRETGTTNTIDHFSLYDAENLRVVDLWDVATSVNSQKFLTAAFSHAMLSDLTDMPLIFQSNIHYFQIACAQAGTDTFRVNLFGYYLPYQFIRQSP